MSTDEKNPSDPIHKHQGAGTGSTTPRERPGAEGKPKQQTADDPIADNAGTLDQMGDHGSHRLKENHGNPPARDNDRLGAGGEKLDVPRKQDR